MGNIYSTRDKAMIIGLYLSRFDVLGLNELGFDGFFHAYNVLGYSIGVAPKSIRGYRDEFDPFFPNERKGWHNRALRPNRKEMMDALASLSFAEFTELIKGFTIPYHDSEREFHMADTKDASNSVAKRLATGVAAEEYFKINYREAVEFTGFELADTRMLACGFDFKLSSPSKYFYVEVKGISLKTGNIALTEKEYDVASEYRDKYCLFVVRNFIESPTHDVFFNPLDCRLEFSRK